MEVVGVLPPVFALLIMTSPDIKTGADLKGKKVGITQVGGTADFLLRLILPKLGLRPDKDVTFISGASIANLVAALESGAIQGTIVVVGHDSLMLQNQGFRVLFDAANIDVPFAESVIGLTRGYVDANRSVVQRYVDSVIEGTALFKKDKNASLREPAKIYKSDDTAGFNIAYDYYARENVTPLLPVPKPEYFKNSLNSLCKKVAQACNYDV